MVDVLLRQLAFCSSFGWFVWWWFVAPSNATQRKESFFEKMSKYTNFFLFGLLLIQLLGLSLLPFHSTVLRVVGALCLISGITLSIQARTLLGKQWVPAYRAVASKKLMTEGVYRYIRHPIYVGIILVYVGIELLAGSWLFVSLIFLLIPIYFQAKKEEKILTNHFGEKYKDYQQQTSMFIPFIF